MGWDTKGGTTDPIKWAAKMKDAPRDAINIFAFSVFNRVVMRTPVDTGALRQNWLVSINEEDHSVLGAEVKYKKIKKRKGENAGKIVTKRSVKLERSANDTMRAGQMACTFAQGDDKIIIQNNLPYARRIEYGHSKIQAPQGMVGLVLAQADRLWNAAVKAAKSLHGEK